MKKITLFNTYCKTMIKIITHRFSVIVYTITITLVVFFCLCGKEKYLQTITSIKKRGVLNCGVSQKLTGFSVLNEEGKWIGFNVDFCRAVAAAIFGNPNQVRFFPILATEQLSALQTKKVDLLVQNIPWTFKKDSVFDFAGIIYYDGLGFMIQKKYSVSSAVALDGSKVCLQKVNEFVINTYFKSYKINYEPVVLNEFDEVMRSYISGRCDVVIGNRLELAIQRIYFKDSKDHIILPEVIQKRQSGIVVRQNDSLLRDIIQWTLFALITAEESGITSGNIDKIRRSPNSIFIRQFLGIEGTFGKEFGLRNDWVYQVIRSVGNYGEIFERHLGKNTPLGLYRGVNALWTNGGLIYAMPFH